MKNLAEHRIREWLEIGDEEWRLRCGELTAQEIRTAKAVLNQILK